MHLYEGSSIDHNWEHLKTVEDTLIELSNQISHVESENIDKIDISTFSFRWEQAQKVAKMGLWEGDFVGEPRVFWLPSFSKSQYLFGFVFKQANNGTTFVLSPYKLPELENSGHLNQFEDK